MAVFSIILESQLEGAKRLDAEYYCSQRLLNTTNFYRGAEVAVKVQYGTSKELNEEKQGYPVLRLNEFEEYFSGTAEKFCDLLSKTQFEDLELKEGDVLICRTNGNPKLVGKAALVIDAKKQAFASYLFRVRTDESKIKPETLVVFLNSKYGRSEIEKFLMPSIQSNFSPAQFREIKIPIFAADVQDQMKDYLYNSYELLVESKSLYSQAENLLLEELGLKGFEKDESLFWTVNLSDIETANRMDAEYFQPKYEKLLSKIRNHNAKTLDDLVSIKKGVEPGSAAYQEEGKLFIRVSSLSKNGIEDRDQKYLSEELYQKFKKDFEPKAREILLTKDATPGTAYYMKESIAGIISGGILRLQLKEEMEPEYLTLCINSVVGHMQVERDAGGSVIAHWRPEQVKNLQIPILPKSVQQKIAELVRRSHEARKKSKELLEEGKRKVEALIEEQSR